jgi:hypothetical protein
MQLGHQSEAPVALSQASKHLILCGYQKLEGSRDSVVGIATRYGLEAPGIESRWGEIFRTYPDRLRGPPILLYNGYRVFPGVKAAGAWCWPHSPSSAEDKKELSYMGPPGPVTGFPLPLRGGRPTSSDPAVNRDPILQLNRQSVKSTGCLSVKEHFKYYIGYTFRL